mmetsp:Transcript_24586/g.79460  ORF Transcript_24586/g.79460 Transcript_24586/m.79460 type:complete len:1163 (+) Transcript_24586:1348-4836(+)
MEAERLRVVSLKFAEAFGGDDEELVASLAREAGEIVQSVDGDVFFSAEENRRELLKGLDPRLVEATTAFTPALASAAVSGLFGGGSVEAKLNDASSMQTMTTAAKKILSEAGLAKATITSLKDEALATGDGRRDDFSSKWLALGAVASTTSIIDIANFSKRDFFASDIRTRYFRDLPGFPRVRREPFRRQAQFLRGNLHLAQDAFFAIIEKTLKFEKKRHQDAVFAWLARALRLSAEPGVLLNVCYVALKLAAPIVDESKGLLSKVDWTIGSTYGRGFQDEPPLLHRDDAAAAEEAQASSDDDDQEEDDHDDALLAKALSMSLDPRQAAAPGFRSSKSSSTSNPSFLTEVFWLGSRALVALQAMALKRHDDAKALRPRGGGLSEEQEEAHAAKVVAFRGAWETHLDDPRLLALAGTFATSAAKELVRFAQENDEDTFASTPAALLKGCCDAWAAQLRATPDEYDARAAARACCALMKRTDLITSPVVHAKLVDVVSTMMFASADRSVDLYSLGGGNGGGAAKKGASAGGRQMAGAVLDHRDIRAELPVALATLYSQLQAVVGLDVDEDTGFDKFTVRHHINDLLLRLWRHPLGEPKTALTEFLLEKDASSKFATACLDNVVYCADDALDRIRDGKVLEDGAKRKRQGTTLTSSSSEGDIADVLDPRRKHYYEAQRRAAAGFLQIADSTLELATAIPLKWPRAVAARGVAVALKLLHSLLDDDKELDVEEPKKRWGFDQPKFVGYCVELLTALKATVDPVVDAGDSLDFDPRALLSRIPTAAHLLATTQTKQQQNNGSSAAAAEKKTKQEEESNSLTLEQQLERTHRALSEALASSPLSPQDAEAAYSRAFSPADDDEEKDGDSGDSSIKAVAVVSQKKGEDGLAFPDYYFAERVSTSLASSLKPLHKELRRLARDLPAPHVDGATFVRFDEGNLQCARCCVSGPAETPYFGGLFVFDVFFPSTYPQVPPLVQLMTTGNGLARFNPNLYADGKVCLSLLGTWHASDDSEKWNPATSNLRQILLSIVAEILVRDPWYNEPGREGQRGTREAGVASDLFNADLRVKTMRHAICDHLKRPPPGLENVVRTHFRHVKSRLLDQCRRDLKKCPQKLKANTRRAVDDLIDGLRRLTDDDHKAKEHAGDDPPPTKKAKQSDDATPSSSSA